MSQWSSKQVSLRNNIDFLTLFCSADVRALECLIHEILTTFSSWEVRVWLHHFNN